MYRCLKAKRIERPDYGQIVDEVKERSVEVRHHHVFSSLVGIHSTKFNEKIQWSNEQK